MRKSRVGKGLTATRGPVHGNFAEGAKITQGIVGILTGASQWDRLSPTKKEAIHMIVHKIHRIVTGNPEHKDHWDDIGGYAQLGADDCLLEGPPLSLAAARPRKAKVRAAKKVAARPAKKAKKAKKAKARRPAVQRDNLTAATNAMGRSRARARRPRAARPSPALVPEVA